jgi:thioredoxin 1
VADRGTGDNQSKRGRKMSKVMDVTDQNFEEEIIKSNLPTEVDFWAPWCGPCVMVSPIYDKLSEEYENFKFCKINVDENPETARKYGIMSIPMQMFFVSGQKVDEILGAYPEHVIRSKIDDILKRFPTSERGRLKVILSSWTEHNRQHGEEFRRWAEKAKAIKDGPIYDSLLQVTREIETVNETLSQLLIELKQE